MNLLAGFCLCALAWVLLSLGLPTHHQSLFGRPPAPRARRGLRAAGWAVLAASFAWFVAGRGWEYGPVFWLAALMLAAVAWVLALAAVAR
ncbi:MAG TPA: DUF3325 domain-containing protein [Pseudoxanthomonas sp.]|nr:DUF3325 domain-containing protein [Pseudoxanthomonas sp.]